MFLSFTKKNSRQRTALTVALVMLFAPAFLVSSETSAQRKNTKSATTEKKNAKSTPSKKTSAKQEQTSKKKTDSKSKQSEKSKRETASKDRKNNKRNEKNERNSAKSNDKNKNSKRLNTKQALAEKARESAKNSKKNNKREAVSKNASRRSTKSNQPEREKPVVAKTSRKTAPKTNSERRSKNETVVLKNDYVASTAELPQIIVTGNSVPVRNQARPDAAAVSNVKLGTVLKVTEKNPAWYRVQFVSDGKPANGWISANSVNDLNGGEREEIYRQIVERNFKTEMDFNSAAELYEFLSNVGGELKSSDASAELEMKRLFALRAALKNIPVGRSDAAPFRDFLAAHEREIVFNEPAGEWLVVSNQFWNLHKKYQKSAASDRIAWEAANNPLPGECEGYVNCYLFDMRMRFGEYLNLYPRGRNSGEALKSLTEYLAPIAADAQQKSTYSGPTDVTDRAEFNNLLAELRTIVSRLNYVEKEKTLQQLKQIAEAYR